MERGRDETAAGGTERLEVGILNHRAVYDHDFCAKPLSLKEFITTAAYTHSTVFFHITFLLPRCRWTNGIIKSAEDRDEAGGR